jgi:hypothetical protein
MGLLRAHHGELDWAIIASARGQPTKIAFGPDRVTVEGFHLYVDPSTVPSREMPR